MGYQDKPLVPLAQKPLIEYVIAAASPQVGQLIISVNRNLDKYTRYSLPLVRDVSAAGAGPLVGIYSAMKWYSNQTVQADYLACFPADVPMFPANLVDTLSTAIAATDSSLHNSVREVAWCQTDTQIQPLFSLWSFKLLAALEQSIHAGVCGPSLFFQNHPSQKVVLPPQDPGMFHNINTLEELAQAEKFIAKRTADFNHN